MSSKDGKRPESERTEDQRTEEQREIVAEEEVEREGAPTRRSATACARFLLFAALWRLLRGEDGRGRKVRWLIGLLLYRAKVALMLVALLAATGAALAPPTWRPAIRRFPPSIPPQRREARLDRRVFIGAALVYAVASYVQTYLVGWVGTRVLQDLRERVFTTCRRCRSASSPAIARAF